LAFTASQDRSAKLWSSESGGPFRGFLAGWRPCAHCFGV